MKFELQGKTSIRYEIYEIFVILLRFDMSESDVCQKHPPQHLTVDKTIVVVRNTILAFTNAELEQSIQSCPYILCNLQIRYRCYNKDSVSISTQYHSERSIDIQYCTSITFSLCVCKEIGVAVANQGPFSFSCSE